MTRAEYEDTAFYQAMVNEGENPEDEFEDHPRPAKKPRIVGPANPRAVVPTKRPGTGPAKTCVPSKQARRGSSQPSTRQASPLQASLRPFSPAQASSRRQSPRQPSPDDDMYYNAPLASPLCRPYDETSEDFPELLSEVQLGDDVLQEDEDTEMEWHTNRHDAMKSHTANNRDHPNAKLREDEMDGDVEDTTVAGDNDEEPEETEAAQVADEDAEDVRVAQGVDGNADHTEDRYANVGGRNKQKLGPFEQEDGGKPRAGTRVRSVTAGNASEDTSVSSGLTKEALLASLMALSEEGDPELLATLATLKLKHAPKRTTRSAARR